MVAAATYENPPEVSLDSNFGEVEEEDRQADPQALDTRIQTFSVEKALSTPLSGTTTISLTRIGPRGVLSAKKLVAGIRIKLANIRSIYIYLSLFTIESRSNHSDSWFLWDLRCLSIQTAQLAHNGV